MAGAAVVGGLAILLLFLEATAPSDHVSSLGSSQARQKVAELSQPGQARFRSRPDLDVPPVKVDVAAHGAALAAQGTAPGYIFLAPKSNGPMIVDEHGNLVWYREGDISNFRAQKYRGRKVLTWWEAPSGDQKRPTYVIANRRYKTIRRFKAGHGYGGDLHEFLLLPNGHAMITAYHAVNRDLRSLGGRRDGVVLDSIAQEVDVKTGRVVWEWHSLDHVPLRDSYNPASEHPDAPYDYFHINSVEPTADGNVLISGRDTFTVYKVSRKTGKIIWRVGGKHSDLKLRGNARFAWQHDAHLAGHNRLVLFDNSDAPPARKPLRNHSRGVILRLKWRQGVATLQHQYVQPEKVLANSQGNVELLRNGNVFVGWGSQPYCTEYSRNGKVLLDAYFEASNSSYRCFRMPWTGRPAEPPAIASEARPNGSVKAWASWNGDTRVATWQLLAGRSPNALAVVGSAPRTGFETEVTASTRRPLVAMRGLDADGNVLGTTAVTEVGTQAQ